MKRQLAIFILVNILFQSCVVYQKTSVSINEAVEQGKVKVINDDGKSTRYANIILEDSIYYGFNSTNRFVKEPLDSQSLSLFYLEDIKNSRNKTLIGVSLGVVFIGLIILGVSTMSFSLGL